MRTKRVRICPALPYCLRFMLNVNLYVHPFKVFYDLQEKEMLSSSSNAEILQCCVSAFDGNIFYACHDGSVHLALLDSWKTAQIMKISCQKLLKLKVFTLADKILVLVLAETASGKASLIVSVVFVAKRLSSSQCSH